MFLRVVKTKRTADANASASKRTAVEPSGRHHKSKHPQANKPTADIPRYPCVFVMYDAGCIIRWLNSYSLYRSDHVSDTPSQDESGVFAPVADPGLPNATVEKLRHRQACIKQLIERLQDDARVCDTYITRAVELASPASNVVVMVGGVEVVIPAHVRVKTVIVLLLFHAFMFLRGMLM